MMRGKVFLYDQEKRGFADSHEAASRAEIANQLARLKGFEFGGSYDPAHREQAPVYLVPNDTITCAEANELGIRSEGDLYGGVVPYPFVATKAITHSLIDSAECAPTGWSEDLGRRIRGVVLAGYTAFTNRDAHRAGIRLLETGPLRLKPARATGGQGQIVVSTSEELNAALTAMHPAQLEADGLVLEENLTDVRTYSVGQVRVGSIEATYYGTQRLTTDNGGQKVYGGSELVVVRGGFSQLSEIDLPSEIALSIEQACAYDAAVANVFPEMFASRRNYDIAQGLDSRAIARSGVLEQSWRVGGASSAEMAALDAFHQNGRLRAVRASSFEIYGRLEAPARATIYFCGTDQKVGPLVKYALAEPYEGS
jgi:hypothetical protein